MCLFERCLDEVDSMEPLARQAALHVNKADKDCVNLAGLDHSFESVEITWFGHGLLRNLRMTSARKQALVRCASYPKV
jgi:hypothetical protein